MLKCCLDTMLGLDRVIIKKLEIEETEVPSHLIKYKKLFENIKKQGVEESISDWSLLELIDKTRDYMWELKCIKYGLHPFRNRNESRNKLPFTVEEYKAVKRIIFAGSKYCKNYTYPIDLRRISIYQIYGLSFFDAAILFQANEACKENKCDYLITRDGPFRKTVEGMANVKVKLVTPNEFLDILEKKKKVVKKRK